MAHIFHSGDKEALKHFFAKRGMLVLGRHVGLDPRFTNDDWSSAIFDDEGFSISYAQMTEKEDYVWQMKSEERSLVIMILLKGMVESRPVDESVVWLGEDCYYISYWNPGETHLVRVAKGYCEMAVFEMKKRFIRRFVDRTTMVRYNGRLVSLPSIRGPFKIIRTMNLSMQHAVFHLIHPEYNPPELEDPERSYLQRLVTLILEDYFRKDDPRIEDLIDYINNNLHKPLRLPDLCKEMSMGETYLRSRFKQTTGKGVRDFILTRKMATAMALVLHSGMSITAIAAEVGYDNLISFEKTFIRRFDYPPTHFRGKRDDESRKV